MGERSVKSFSDERGMCWRVWKVETPAASAHLMDASLRDGWLVFEREDGRERRRLAQVPDDWADLIPERLALLCEVATPVSMNRTGATAPRALAERPGDRSRG